MDFYSVNTSPNYKHDCWAVYICQEDNTCSTLYQSTSILKNQNDVILTLKQTNSEMGNVSMMPIILSIHKHRVNISSKNVTSAPVVASSRVTSSAGASSTVTICSSGIAAAEAAAPVTIHVYVHHESFIKQCRADARAIAIERNIQYMY